MAFKIAGSMGIKDAFEKAGCVLLEPMMKVEVVVPDEYLGDVLGNINARRGRVEGTEQRGNSQTIRGIGPLSEMFGYCLLYTSRWV